MIARGGMGRIYRAEQLPIGRSVALKVLSPRYEEVEPAFEKRFLQEAATCGRLRHPNTVVLYDYGRIEEAGVSTLFMAMELIEGPTLRRVLREEGALDEVRAVEICRGIGRSLREAHKLQIVHRDLKPSNVMLVPSEEGDLVKVVDFGVAKLMHSDSESLTMSDNIVGSPRYMAPEQIRNQAVDGRADIYSLGILLFEMLAGRAPFEGERAMDTLMLHLSAEFPTIKALSGRAVDPDLEQIVRRATGRYPQERFADIDEMLRALGRWARRHGDPNPAEDGRTVGPAPPRRSRAELDITMPSGVSPIPPATPQPRGQPRAAVALAALAVVLLLAAIWRFTNAPVPAPAPVAEATPPTAPVLLEPARRAPTDVALVLTSTPTGAAVWEGPQQLGQTPLTVRLATASPERTFTFRLPGHAEATVTQAGVPADLERSVTLIASEKKVLLRPPEPPDDLKRNR